MWKKLTLSPTWVLWGLVIFDKRLDLLSFKYFTLGQSFKCIGIRYKPCYRDLGLDFRDLVPNFYNYNFFFLISNILNVTL
jgi:hypothetical protein